MYSSERANKIESNDIKLLGAGIHENVSFVAARTEKTPNGNSFLELKFEKNGAVLTHTEWEPTAFNGMSDADLQLKQDKQFKRLLQVLKCFYKPEMLVFNGSNFTEFANWVVNLLNNADKSILLRIKAIYNNKGYITLPAYAKYTFIEPMILPEGETSVVVQLNVDNFEKVIVADKEESVNTDNVITSGTMGASTVINGELSSGLPF